MNCVIVQKNVSKMTEGAQNPAIDRDNIFIRQKLPSGNKKTGLDFGKFFLESDD